MHKTKYQFLVSIRSLVSKPVYLFQYWAADYSLSSSGLEHWNHLWTTVHPYLSMKFI